MKTDIRVRTGIRVKIKNRSVVTEHSNNQSAAITTKTTINIW